MSASKYTFDHDQEHGQQRRRTQHAYSAPQLAYDDLEPEEKDQDLHRQQSHLVGQTHLAGKHRQYERYDENEEVHGCAPESPPSPCVLNGQDGEDKEEEKRTAIEDPGGPAHPLQGIILIQVGYKGNDKVEAYAQDPRQHFFSEFPYQGYDHHEES